MRKIQSIDSIEAIKMSIQCEVDMVKYYMDASGLIQNDDALAILHGLAQKKERRRLELVRLYSKLCGKKILYLNLGRKHKLNTLLTCPDNADEAVHCAKLNEKELRSFYTTISRRLLEPQLRQFFRHMVTEEDQYLALLESSFEESLTLTEEPADKKVQILNAVASTESNVW